MFPPHTAQPNRTPHLPDPYQNHGWFCAQCGGRLVRTGEGFAHADEKVCATCGKAIRPYQASLWVHATEFHGEAKYRAERRAQGKF